MWSGLLNWNQPELSIGGAGQEDRSSGNENCFSDEEMTKCFEINLKAHWIGLNYISTSKEGER